MAQERMDDWMEYARELARAERELGVPKKMDVRYGDDA